jgi:hypothetical protein
LHARINGNAGDHMRTTLDIDDDVLAAAKSLARHQSRSVGQVISELARRALTQVPAVETHRVVEPKKFYGFVPFNDGKRIVTDEQVNQLRDGLGL